MKKESDDTISLEARQAEMRERMLKRAPLASKKPAIGTEIKLPDGVLEMVRAHAAPGQSESDFITEAIREKFKRIDEMKALPFDVWCVYHPERLEGIFRRTATEIWSLFADEAGVIFERPDPDSDYHYRTMKVPGPVVERVYRKLYPNGENDRLPPWKYADTPHPSDPREISELIPWRDYNNSDLAKIWKISRDEVYRLFQDEPGVVKRHTGKWHYLVIPGGLARRVYRQHQHLEQPPAC